MKISVVMATYNGASHIREQLDSIERQTLTPDEVLIGDDGSSDATLAIVRDFAARTSIPVTVAEKSERLGFADNFLWTAERSRHDLIALCDQDDLWLPDKLERARDRIKRDGS
ncbi:MAG: glycosyltransferase, partial [Oxalobacteraceae bacterium]